MATASRPTAARILPPLTSTLNPARAASLSTHDPKPAILHRDLKSSNLLCDDGYTVKICDFGLARLKKARGVNAATATLRDERGTPGTKFQQATMTGNCGTVHWMAPEVLTNDRYSETADMYR